MHEPMQYDGRHSFRFKLCIEQFMYDLYDITDSDFLSEFRL